MTMFREEGRGRTVCESSRSTFIAEGEDTNLVIYVSTAFTTSIVPNVPTPE